MLLLYRRRTLLAMEKWKGAAIVIMAKLRANR